MFLRQFEYDFLQARFILLLIQGLSFFTVVS